jgi:hypothetical protein
MLKSKNAYYVEKAKMFNLLEILSKVQNKSCQYLPSPIIPTRTSAILEVMEANGIPHHNFSLNNFGD